jgi:hypothetical protein
LVTPAFASEYDGKLVSFRGQILQVGNSSHSALASQYGIEADNLVVLTVSGDQHQYVDPTSIFVSIEKDDADSLYELNPSQLLEISGTATAVNSFGQQAIHIKVHRIRIIGER